MRWEKIESGPRAFFAIRLVDPLTFFTSWILLKTARIHEKCKWVSESYNEKKPLDHFKFCPNAHPNLSLIFGYVGFWTEIISCEPLSDIQSEKSDIIQDALGGYCTDDRALKIVRFSI